MNWNESPAFIHSTLDLSSNSWRERLRRRELGSRHQNKIHNVAITGDVEAEVWREFWVLAGKCNSLQLFVSDQCKGLPTNNAFVVFENQRVFQRSQKSTWNVLWLKWFEEQHSFFELLTMELNRCDWLVVELSQYIWKELAAQKSYKISVNALSQRVEKLHVPVLLMVKSDCGTGYEYPDLNLIQTDSYWHMPNMTFGHAFSRCGFCGKMTKLYSGPWFSYERHLNGEGAVCELSDQRAYGGKS